MKPLALALLFSFSFPSVLCALTVKELQEKMADSDLTLKTVQFDYVQELASGLSDEIQRSSGTAYFKKPKQLRIEQKSPEKQLIVCSGKTVFVYTPRFNQVIKDSWDRWISKNTFFPGLLGFSETLHRLKSQYRWEITGEFKSDEGNNIVVQMNDLTSGHKSQLKIWVSESDFIPRKTELVLDTLTLTTTLVSVKKNIELDDPLFRFQRPANAKVIQIP